MESDDDAMVQARVSRKSLLVPRDRQWLLAAVHHTNCHRIANTLLADPAALVVVCSSARRRRPDDGQQAVRISGRDGDDSDDSDAFGDRWRVRRWWLPGPARAQEGRRPVLLS